MARGASEWHEARLNGATRETNGKILGFNLFFPTLISVFLSYFLSNASFAQIESLPVNSICRNWNDIRQRINVAYAI